ncbi:Heavy metal transport/detoxification superfamily protein [Hibiscus syriacus]|uniref:Heavy metal transport/detoxification superfamily protein n=1 Tax=Hibiscus syriacus TaxID=106335 RepID=A0A6A3C830_HIBSY|nr:Heavy metal transport/detoxification superfamily protein [Hibiscus syriacus]
MELKSNTLLSKIATNDGHAENSPYFDGWKAYDSNPFHPTQNPHGVIQMGLAEDKKWILENPGASICTAQGVDKFNDIAIFKDYYGLKEFREAVAKFMGRVGGNKVTFDANRIVMSGGATAANETVMFCLDDPGDAFLVPSPYYAGSLEDAYEKAQTWNINVKGVIIANSWNPLGIILDPDTIRSMLVQGHEDPGFSSWYRVFVQRRSYALCSQDVEFRGSLIADAVFACFDAFGRRVRGKFPEGELREDGQRHHVFTKGLEKVGISCLASNAGLFFWMDMRPLLKEQSLRGELELWRVFINEVKLNVSPDSSFRCSEPGWFRVCFANMDDETIEVALDRIRAFVLGRYNQEPDKSKHGQKKRLRLSFSSLEYRLGGTFSERDKYVDNMMRSYDRPWHSMAFHVHAEHIDNNT